LTAGTPKTGANQNVSIPDFIGAKKDDAGGSDNWRHIAVLINLDTF